ncbi:MAG: hypothetical protein F4Y97_08410 [Dehalococcoidia bacterium]|nr:hypothetical protein [Dehalococcoidia bacterium]
MKTTWYFDNIVLPGRPEVDVETCLSVLAAPMATEAQPNGRMRFWGEVPFGDSTRVLRVVTLEDGETVHNAVFDRSFRREAQ